MKIKSITTANGETYHPVNAKTKGRNLHEGCFLPVCFIRKIFFGCYKIDFWTPENANWDIGVSNKDNQKPNTRIILFPFGIRQIEWITE